MPSSVIRRFDYDAVARRMTITFVSGDIYAYLGVPPVIAERLGASGSKGRFFARSIRDRYPFERIRIAVP